MNIHAPASHRHLRLNALDNLVVAVDPIEKGAVIEGVTAAARVPRGHKMATARIAMGEPVITFGQIIGFAHAEILPGQHIHSRNCDFTAFERDHRHAEDVLPRLAVAFRGLLNSRLAPAPARCRR